MNLITSGDGRASALDGLAAVLARQPAASAQELAARLGLSLPTVHRLLRAAPDRVVSLGRARRPRPTDAGWRRPPPWRADRQASNCRST